jgi:eukaryotic-like serine/threonine-protein kinase
VHAALSALHTSGLVHEHIEPVNVLAVGETVKLRSDCVRECIADIEFNTPEGCAQLRRRDVNDFGMLLLQCLTLEKRYNPGLNLPDVFRRMIPHMLDGTWTLEQVGQVINPPVAAPIPSASSASAKPGAQMPPARAVMNGSNGAQKASNGAQPEQGKLPLDQPQPAIRAAADPALRYRREVAEESSGFSLRPWMLAGIAAVLVCIIAIWHFVGAKPAKPAQSASPAAATAAPQQAAPGFAPRPAVHPAQVNANVPAGTHAPGWYVISYTYNHEGQAQTKAERLNGHHAGFHAEVFSPRGGAPFLVSLGGPMSEAEAKALQERARRSGFPRDTYIRNYR